jgi:ribosomal protein S18 acetylase RimI-like enzyme
VTPTDWHIEIVTTEMPLLLEEARALFVEYYEWLGEVVCSERLAEEIASLPAPYAPPQGRLLLATNQRREATGVVGVRYFEPGICEMKRLYVRPVARRSGLGRLLAEQAVGAARDLGYTELRLTTLPGTMDAALALYRSLGFVDTGPFTDHSHVANGIDIAFLRLPLVPQGP